MRNGRLFICELKCIDKNNVSMNIKLDINTEVETFTKCSVYSRIEEGMFSVVCSSNKDDEIMLYHMKLLSDESSLDKSVLITDKQIIYIGDDKKTDQDDSDNASSKSNGLVSVILTEENLPFFLVAQESSRLMLIDKQNLLIIKSINLFDQNEEVRTVLSLKIIIGRKAAEYYIVIGFYHNEIQVVKYNSNTNTIYKDQLIKDSCSPLKPGISCIDYCSFKKKEEIFNDYSKINYVLVTGSYDYRFRIYEIMNNENADNNLLIKYLGFNNIQKDSIIHEIKFYEDKQNNNLYLLVLSDQKFILIFSIL